MKLGLTIPLMAVVTFAQRTTTNDCMKN